MTIKFMNDWRSNAYGKAFSPILIGYMNIKGLPPQINFVLLGLGISIQWRRKK